jgi:DNA-directed RNA polymerase subunit N (RpoN/RPB10)
MLYLICPSCGYLLGNKIIHYEDEKNKICNNPELTNKQKEDKLTELLLSLKLRRYCCKMRIMTYKDIVQDILPVSEDNQQD